MVAISTQRTAFQELREQLEADQTLAMVELYKFLNEEASVNFITKLMEFHQRTVPGGLQDQMLNSTLNTIRNANELAGRMSEANKPVTVTGD